MSQKKGLSLLVVALLASVSAAAQALTLHDAILHTLHTNPTLLENSARRLTFNEALKQAWGDWYPVVELNAGYGKERTLSPTAATNRWLWRREFSASATQNIFAGFSTINEIRRNKFRVLAQAYRIFGVANDVALDVATRDLEILRDQRRLAAVRRNLVDVREIYSRIADRSGAGVGDEADKTLARGRLARSEAAVLAARNNLRESQINFIRVVGMAPRDLIMPRIPRDAQLPKTEALGLAIASGNHPTLRSAREDVNETRYQHEVAKAVNLPFIDFLTLAGMDHNLDGQPGRNNQYYWVIRANYVLFRGGRDLARQRETAFQIQEALEVRNNTMRQVDRTLQLSMNNFRFARARVPYLRNYFQSVAQVARAYKQQYTIGKRSLLDLLDIVNEELSSRLEYLDTQFEEYIARYRVLNATGELLQALHIPLPHEAVSPSLAVPHSP